MRQAIRNFVKGGRQIEPIWRYGFNFLPSIQYKFKPSANSGGAVRPIIDRLNENGIVITSVDELFQDRSYFAELDSAVGNLLAERRHELEDLKRQAADSDAIGEKTFNVELLGSRVEFDPASIFARFALQETFLNIANSYFGMLVKLRYYNIWQTFATTGAPRESQLWHFDREDNYILKMFLYLKDVDEGAGPFTYAPKTHRKVKYWSKQPAYTLEKNVRRSTDEQMSAVIPKENWIKGVGKKGTIIFADTRGFHKGGEARSSDRLMFTMMFTSAASDSKRLLQISDNLPLSNLTKKQVCALEIK